MRKEKTMTSYSEDYLLNKKVRIYQPEDGYRASIDAVFLAAAVDSLKNGDTILDVGSGTGAVSLCLAERFKNLKAVFTGLELQENLSELSNKSAAANGFSPFLRFENKNFFHNDLPNCSFTHVLSNPPYSDHDMPSPNPSKAMAHNYSWLGAKEWILQMIKMIRPQGAFYMVNRAEALDEILSVLHGRLGGIEIFPLQSKLGHSAKRVIVRARKDCKTPLKIHPFLTIHNTSGEYSEAAKRILYEGESLDKVLF